MWPAATMVLLSGAHGAIVSALQRPPGESTVLVVTTGANPAFEGGEPPAWLRQSLTTLAAIGFAFAPYDIAGRTEHEILTAIAPCDIVYVSGGNTFYLLQEMRASGFDAVLDKFLSDPSHVYVGASAGAAVMCPDIAYAAPIDDPAAAPLLASTKGLGHVGVAVLPHVELDSAGRAVDPAIASCISIARESGDEVVLLRDDQALVVRNGITTIVPSS